MAVAVLVAACGSSVTSTTAFQGFSGCSAGAGSAIVFLQRALDVAGRAEPPELAAALPEFDREVRGMMLRAQEVHCTEEGFNAAIIARVDELTAGGPGGELLVAVVRARGLGSLDTDNGGLIELPSG
ncbi:MAG: hypothetical protein BMS9Abin07_1407 [Acidimicrobiia bacterium]|nr:MAG: hypothetical protein BMS9Abin07_1407 [Acidimicrobiia bacterium]